MVSLGSQRKERRKKSSLVFSVLAFVDLGNDLQIHARKWLEFFFFFSMGEEGLVSQRKEIERFWVLM